MHRMKGLSALNSVLILGHKYVELRLSFHQLRKNCFESSRQWIWASTVAISVFEWIITLLDKVAKIYSADPSESALLKLKYPHCFGWAALWSWENNWVNNWLSSLHLSYWVVSSGFLQQYAFCYFHLCFDISLSLVVLAFFPFHRVVCFNRRFSWRI